MYSHTLLLALADLCALSVKQIELTDRWLQMWARKMFPHIKQQPTKGPVLLMDLEAGVGAALVSRLPQHPNESMRFGYPMRLAISVRARLRKLETGAKPPELKLGTDCSTEQCTILLSHLQSKWCQLPRSHAGRPTALVSLCGGGLAATFFRLMGRTFEQGESAPQPAYQGARGMYLQTVGAPGEDPDKDDAERAWGWEEWQGAYDRQDAVLTRVGPMRHRWFLDQLIVVRDPEQLRLGHATRVAHGEDGQMHLSVRLFLSSAQALTMRPTSGNSAEDLPFAAALLVGTNEEKASLILPPRTFSQGRVLRSSDPSGEKKWRLTCLLHRGGDFERVLFEPGE